MLGGRSWDDWIAQYSRSHQHPFNRVCHVLGIPLIALSLPLFLVTLVTPGFWVVPTALFVVGWVFQFVGHAVEGKPPESSRTGAFSSSGCAGGSPRSVDERRNATSASGRRPHTMMAPRAASSCRSSERWQRASSSQ